MGGPHIPSILGSTLDFPYLGKGPSKVQEELKTFKPGKVEATVDEDPVPKQVKAFAGFPGLLGNPKPSTPIHPKPSNPPNPKS